MRRPTLDQEFVLTLHGVLESKAGAAYVSAANAHAQQLVEAGGL
jgi:hypothetical protein